MAGKTKLYVNMDFFIAFFFLTITSASYWLVLDSVVCRFSSGFETASFVASSGLLSSPWNLILELNTETNPNEILFWKNLGNGSDLTIIAFGTTLEHVQPDLVCSTDMMDNPFEFLCSRKYPNFSLNKSAVSLFNEHRQNLGQLKSEVRTSLSSP